MRIPGFSYFITNYVQKHTLNDTVVVIDGDDYFYDLYSASKISYVLGSESDRLADYIREDLMKYKNANIKCYFVFQGGNADIEKSLNEIRSHGRDYVLMQLYTCNNVNQGLIEPIFAKEIYKQVLKEMEFDYVLCQYDSKNDCVALAQRFFCPIIGFDIEYCFSGVDYIPYKAYSKKRYAFKSSTQPSINYDESTNGLVCGIFKLNDFLKTCELTDEKLAIFAVLTDENIFPRKFFADFFRSVRTSPNNTFALLSWLSRKNEDDAMKEIFQCISARDQEEFLIEKKKVETMIRKKNDEGIPTLYFTNRNEVDITESDPLWFEKGVTLEHVAVSYINVYKYKIVEASNSVESNDQENSIIVCLDIIKYAYDLLTNFAGDEIYLRYRKSMSDPISEQSVKIDYSTIKPEYDANNCVFENGWQNIRSLNLFQHFIQETLQLDFSKLDRAPDDARLLIIALVYFARKIPKDTKNEVYCIMLSYVMLSSVNKTQEDHKPIKINETKCSLLDPTVDRASILADDYSKARYKLKDFFTVRSSELWGILNRETLHPLVQFQHCLYQLNNLNTLCGKPFEPTKYNKTYNGTFVYKLVRFIRNEGSIQTIKDKLNPAASVLAFFTEMIDIFEEVMSQK